MINVGMFKQHLVSFARYYNANQGLEHPHWFDDLYECSLMYPLSVGVEYINFHYALFAFGLEHASIEGCI